MSKLSLAFVAVLFLALPATSSAVSYCSKDFYSDATYTNLVGGRTTNCQGQTYSWGVVTAFKLVGCEPCGGGAVSLSTQSSGTVKPLDIAPAACLTPVR